MSTLERHLRAAVDRPPFPPAPIEELQRRRIRLARRRWFRRCAGALGVGGVVAVGALALTGTADETSVRVAGDGPTTRTIVATAPGGYVASGDWRLVIVRGDERIELDDEHSAPCGDDTIAAGDVLTAAIGDHRSSIRAGEGHGCTTAGP